jgi:hypothetical protein
MRKGASKWAETVEMSGTSLLARNRNLAFKVPKIEFECFAKVGEGIPFPEQ